MVHVGEGTEKLPTLACRVEHPAAQLPGWSIERGWNTNSQTLPSLQSPERCRLSPAESKYKGPQLYGVLMAQSTSCPDTVCHDPQSSRKNKDGGSSVVVQWLRLSTFIAMGLGSIPGQRTKIPQVAWCSQKIKLKNKNKNGSDHSLEEKRFFLQD